MSRYCCRVMVSACCVWLFAGPSVAPAQKIVIGEIAKPDQQSEATRNDRIESDWGKPLDGWSVRIAPASKSRWGIAESPTFLLQLKNDAPAARQLEIRDRDLQVVINGQAFHWNSPGTRLVSELKAGEVRENFFILRLDASQWKSAAEQKDGDPERLPVLDPGKKKLQVKLEIGGDEKNPQVLVGGTVEFEVTESAFELPSVSGTLLGEDGQPLADAEIYLCQDAQFSIYYSGFNGKWFTTKRVSHFDPASGRFSSNITPIKTDKTGNFSLSPGARDKRIVVLPPQGSAQLFDLPASFRNWKVQLRETGRLVIERDIPGDTATDNTSLISTRRLAANDQNSRTNHRLTESFQVPLANGQKYEFEGMAPINFRFNRYRYVKIDNRSYSIGRTNISFDIEPGKETAFRMVRKSGQQVTLTASGIPPQSQYVMAAIFERDETVNLETVYGNRTVWADAKIGKDGKISFESSLVSPGKYRAVVMSVPQASVPNKYVYKPDLVGSQEIEVSESGKLDVGEIRLFPVDLWVQNSGMALMLELVNANGEPVANRTVWLMNQGYQPGFEGDEFSFDSKGRVQAVKPPGEYRLAVGLDQNQPVLFDVQVPRMTAQRIELPDPATWTVEKKEDQPVVRVAGKYDREAKALIIQMTNQSEQPIMPRFGELQLWMQRQPEDISSGIRFLPPPDSEIYRQTIEPGATREVKVSMAQVLSEWLSATTRLTALNLQKQEVLDEDGWVWGVCKFGPAFSKPFSLVELPDLPPKPFR